ncbi:MAG: hypothetical protein RSB09_02850 [Clostridia bacterium]
MKILFVCSSNVCRSPYAEFVMRKLIAESDDLKDLGIEVSSSAVFNQSKEIHKKAVASLVAEGFDEKEVRAHRPTFKRSDKKRFEDADLIIGMSKVHYILTPKKYRAKFHTLSEISTGYYFNIPDPFMSTSQERYNEVMAMIREYLVLFLGELENDAKLNKIKANK